MCSCSLIHQWPYCTYTRGYTRVPAVMGSPSPYPTRVHTPQVTRTHQHPDLGRFTTVINQFELGVGQVVDLDERIGEIVATFSEKEEGKNWNRW